MKNRIFAIIAVLVVGFATMTGCAGDSNPKEEIQVDRVTPGDSQVETFTYKGNELNCITWWGSHGETGMNCDWVEYHERYGFEDSGNPAEGDNSGS